MSRAALCDEIIYATVGDDALLKDIEFSGDDLVTGETISAVNTIAKYSTDYHWQEATVTTDITVESNGSSGTIAQIKISDINTAGRYRIDVTVTTSESQKLVAQCRLHVEA